MNNSNIKYSPVSQSRRSLLIRGSLLGSAGLILATDLRPGIAFAQDGTDLPRLSEEDTTAQALLYVHDAEMASNERNSENAYCFNCLHFQGDETTQWAACQIFPGKAVNADGWCRTWVIEQ
tara:strand:- start:750 stop:1112 length:363 start_codon:yes stop_codon:yes gene_type:complete